MSTENVQEYKTTSENSNGLCRLCGGQDLTLIDIFSEEGSENEISNKIEMYIPIKLVESKDQPLHSCLECINAILSWHDFILKVLETNKRLSVKNEISSPAVVDDNSEKRRDHIPEDLNGAVVHFENDQSTNGEDYKLNINTTSEEICVQDDCEVVNIEFVGENTEPKNPTLKKSSKLRRKKCEVDNKFFCETCDKGFTRKFDMQRHKKLKHDEVDTNSEERRKNREIISKCRIHEDGKILYECYICQQRTNHSYNLMRHMNKHTGVKTYICHICGKTFRLDSSFRKHIKQFHEGVKNYKCEICDKTFGSRSARDEHLNTHSGHRPFACDICHKSFKQKSSLYVHKLYHEKNFKFECSLCDKKFRRAQELAVHDRMHSGQKPYSCDVCGVKFRRSQELKRHRKIHSANNIEWTCQICESTFTQERFLKLHRKVHAAPDT